MERVARLMSAGKITTSLFLLGMFTVGCSTNSTGSDIPGQLEDGGWVMNVPGQSHLHRVVLAECPDQPIITTHVHDHDQVGRGPHKHNGCFTCPTQSSLKSRLLK